MVESRQSLQFHLDADRFALNRGLAGPAADDDIWRFQIALRKLEYYENVKQGFAGKKLRAYYRGKKRRLGLRLGFDIPINVFGPGLRINHFGGGVVVSPLAKVGRWCDLHQGVNIGSNNSADGRPLVPKIGANVWIGPGAKIFGGIVVGDGVQIGANAVVCRDVRPNVTVGGVPAKIINETGTEAISVAASRSRMETFIAQHPQYRSYFEIDEPNRSAFSPQSFPL